MLPKSFYEGRNKPKVHTESWDYTQWLEQEIGKCINGYSDGGYTITGRMYFYLNHWKIEQTRNKVREFSHPIYTFYQHDVFDLIEQADREGKAFIWVSGRGSGKSYSISSIVGHMYTFYERSESFITASAKPNIDPLMDKVRNGLDNITEGFYHNRLKNTADNIISGEVDSKGKATGFQSEIRSIIFGDKADKTRGTRPRIQVFEEAGSWNGSAKLKECYEKSEGAWKVDNKLSCLPIIMGTGGEMLSGGSEDFKHMFNNPDSIQAITFTDTDNPRKKIGYFTPAHHVFFDRTCNTEYIDPKDKEKVIELEIAITKNIKDADRKIKRESGVQSSYYQEIQEYPYTHQEAFLVKGTNMFNRDKLEAQMNNIISVGNTDLENPHPRYIQRGHLHWVDEQGNITSKITGKVVWESDMIDGIFQVIEHPKHETPKGLEELDRINKGKVQTQKINFGRPTSDIPHGIYVSGCDSFDHDIDIDERRVRGGNNEISMGSMFVFKRIKHYGDFGMCPVAELTHRPKTANEFYENTLKLNCYYNSRMLFEHTTIRIINFYEVNKMAYQYLMVKPKCLTGVIDGYKPDENKYGLPMPEVVKRHLEKICKDYIEDFSENIWFPDLLKDLMTYSKDQNYDRAIAFFLCLIHDMEISYINEDTILMMNKKKVTFHGYQPKTARR